MAKATPKSEKSEPRPFDPVICIMQLRDTLECARQHQQAACALSRVAFDQFEIYRRNPNLIEPAIAGTVSDVLRVADEELEEVQDLVGKLDEYLSAVEEKSPLPEVYPASSTLTKQEAGRQNQGSEATTARPNAPRVKLVHWAYQVLEANRLAHDLCRVLEKGDMADVSDFADLLESVTGELAEEMQEAVDAGSYGEATAEVTRLIKPARA